MTDLPQDSGLAPAARPIVCADCERSDSAAYDITPVDHMPIPTEALTGFADGVPRQRRWDRRAFLRNGAIGVAAVYGASKLDWTGAFEAARAEGAEANGTVVMIFLNGGWDGLNAMVPLGPSGYAAYQAARPTIARVPGPTAGAQVGATTIPGTGDAFAWANPLISGVGNNGTATGFDTLWGTGAGGPGSDLAAWPAVNYANNSRSHFDSRDYWFSGVIEKSTTGWLGRWLDTYGSTTNPLQAITMGSRLSKMIKTAKAPVAAVQSLNGIGFGVTGSPAGLNTTELMAPVAEHKASAGNEQYQHARDSYARTVQVSRSLASLSGAPLNGGYPLMGPAASLSQRLRLAAALIQAGLGTKVITLDWGGFDTHGNQLASMDPQLSGMSAALAAFRADLTLRGVEGRVMTLVFSEFGRRIEMNDTGTDHGNGGLMLAMGSRIRGGLAGDWPGVDANANDGDLAAATDFRSVFKQITSEFLGGDPDKIIPNAPGPTPRPLLK